MIRITIIFPTYGRPQQALDTFKSWINMAEKPNEVEILIAMDSNDDTILDYYRIFDVADVKKLGRFEINIGKSTCTVEAMNRTIKTLSNTAELIVGVSDDMDPIFHWDTELFKTIHDVDNFKEPKYIVTCDGVANLPNVPYDGMEKCCYVMINRAFYNRLGYFIYPGYKHLTGDEDLFNVAVRLNAIVDARHLYFPHNRWSQDGTKIDETYKKQSNDEKYFEGQKILLDRINRNFDLN